LSGAAPGASGPRFQHRGHRKRQLVALLCSMSRLNHFNMATKSFLLTDRGTDTWRESFELGPREIDLGADNWSIRKRVLHGGLSEGVEIVEVDNGALAFTVLASRGMGLWKGRYKELDLGWSSPAIGP